MARHLDPRDIPEAAKTARVDVFDEDGVKTGTSDALTSYFWQTLDGGRFVGQASAQEKGMFEIDEDVIEPTIQVNKYGMDGQFLGGPWRIRDIA